MQWKITILVALLVCTHGGVLGVSLFNFWSHILPGGLSNPSDNSVVPSSGEENTSAEVTTSRSNATLLTRAKEIDNMSSEEYKLTSLLNPMSWFKKTPKENSFQINAELGTVRHPHS